MVQADRFAEVHNLQLPSILINAAGVTRDGCFIQDISEQGYDLVLDTNLKGTFHTCQAFCSLQRVDQLCSNEGGGTIVNIGSVISERGNI
jgi:3-oxoacyl-[acyl-carrier protein] reductase